MSDIKTKDFYKNWLSILPQLNEGYLYDEHKKLRPTRYVFTYFTKLINDFLQGKISELEKIILLPGIRGVGKTTLLMQIYRMEKFLNEKKRIKLDSRFYFDVSKLSLEQISLNEFFKFFEKINNINFVKPAKKIILLLDEVHFDEKWGLFLKTLFDSIKGHQDLLVIATGSSAINLKISADLMRRSTTVELFPMKFNEYLLLKHYIDEKNYFAEKLENIFFNSKDAGEVFSALKEMEPQVNRFFAGLPIGCEDNFFKNGGFPFVVNIQNEVEKAERIRSVINGIIIKDIMILKKFKTETISKINDLLYLLANSDVVSYEKIQQSLRIKNIRTLNALLEVLVMSGILIKVKSYGRTYGGTRKTAKYLFITPSLRCAILDNQNLSGLEGKKLEDYFALIFEKDLKKTRAHSLHYDFAEKGADFVLTLTDRSNIVVEVGFHKETAEQVVNTMKKVRSRYGLVFGSRDLCLVDKAIVKIPLRFLLLA